MEWTFWISISCFIAMTTAASLNTDVTSDVQIIDLAMKGAIPTTDDAYICSSHDMPVEESYIVKYEALANASTAHHILLYGCTDGPAKNTPTWGCPPLCRGREQIMFAWAKNAPPTTLPKDVGFRIGGQSGIKNIVLQIHYAHKSNSPDHSGIRIYVTQQKQKYVAGIFLMMSYSITIPGQTPVVHSDISCKYPGDTSIHPFAYRTHAHDLGRVITGYVVNDTYNLIGKGNPQWPQAFYPVQGSITIKPGDIMVARCTFNSTGRDRYTYVGATANDEMCNFYTMFYTDASVRDTYSQCHGSSYPGYVDNLPADSDTPLPPNPLLDEKAGHHHHHPSQHKQQKPTVDQGTKLDTDLLFEGKWPKKEMNLGQISGVATDSDGNIYVFHRGSRIWDIGTFDVNNVFQQQDQPIAEQTLMVFDKDGNIIRSFGEKRFYLPHGLAVDENKNIWVTDVGLHQVLRFPHDSNEPDLVLGEKFIPDADEKHFCKPTDIAVLSNGDFFVSDGYCNARIMKYNENGTLLTQFGKPDMFATADGKSPNDAFNVPHSLTVAEDKGLLCVADRENGRIQCFDLNGKFVRQIKHKEFGTRLFAIEYSPLHGGVLFAVNGQSFSRNGVVVQGFTIDINTGNILQSWNSKRGMKSPHDLAVNPVDHSVYVGELDNSVWKFIMAHTSNEIATPDKKELDKGDEPTDTKNNSNKASVTPAVVIGVLLVVPVVLVLVITISIKLYKNGQCWGRKRGNRVFNIQNFFNSHKGFDRLSTEESDHEYDIYDGSDQEEYTAPVKPIKPVS